MARRGVQIINRKSDDRKIEITEVSSEFPQEESQDGEAEKPWDLRDMEAGRAARMGRSRLQAHVVETAPLEAPTPPDEAPDMLLLRRLAQ